MRFKMPNVRATPRQREILEALNALNGSSDGWGPIWERYGGTFQRFDKVANACLAKGFVVENEYGRLTLTASGGKILSVPAGD